MLPAEASEQGLYHEGTRHLSRLEVLLWGKRPLLLSSTVSDDNIVFTADLTNPDVLRRDAVAMPRGEIHLSRSRVLWEGSWFERIRVANYALRAIEVSMTITFDADFADIFEVRGTRRARRGERLPDVCGDDCLLQYRGIDRVERRTRLRWTPQPKVVEPGRATFVVQLESHGVTEIELTVCCESVRACATPRPFEQALARSRGVFASRTEGACRVVSSSESLNRWISRSTADLQMMLTDTSTGPYPYAGIPWFSTPFGRDGILTALSLLWAYPAIGKGVLSFLAETQATEKDDAREAQPGKILHEMRSGEMAALAEVPFGRYYGSVDATPLFVMLAREYYERTGDRDFIDQLWPHILAALDWLRTDGDRDGDGFIEYFRQSESGLVQQGWKDSWDSVFHADGTIAPAPIALCEVQGYAYAAWSGAARLADLRGDTRSAEEWQRNAARLRGRFESTFWCEDLGSYALALDGDKQPCRVRSSNPGHCLFTGIVQGERARRVAATLMSSASFSGWGVRTIADHEARYNPMAYHNGSVWPHDNAIVAAGLARCGLIDDANRILTAIFDLSQAMDLHRLPELICGFSRRGGEFPTLYPVACAPQAWAAAAVYLLLEACLGLRVAATARRVSFARAILPQSIDWLRITNLAVNDARVDLLIERHPHDVGVTVLKREGEVEITVVK